MLLCRCFCVAFLFGGLGEGPSQATSRYFEESKRPLPGKDLLEDIVWGLSGQASIRAGWPGMSCTIPHDCVATLCFLDTSSDVFRIRCVMFLPT